MTAVTDDASADDLRIVPLSRERLADLDALFDEGGDAKRCRCAFWRVRGGDWSNWTRDANRGVLEEVADRDPAPGLVAYAGDRVVGWVSVGPREDYARLEHSRVLARVDDLPVWSVVCFVVSRRWRGKGVAKALLDAAVEHAGEHGATLVEAYPVEAGPRRVPAASAYMGPLGMYEQAGFEVVARQQWQRSSVRPIVRKSVKPASPVRHPSR
jgi:GNAT superfamily N-acetyltransferase